MGIIILICFGVICFCICFAIWSVMKCQHKYKLIQQIEVIGDYSNLPRYRKYVSECEHCGKIKIVKG